MEHAVIVVYWQWLILAVVCFILEVLMPGAIFMWFGFGAVVTGILLWLIPSLSFPIQLLIFAVLSIVSLFAWRKSPFFHPDNLISDTPDLNDRLRSHIGKVYTLTEPIVHGVGAVKVDGSIWRVLGEDAPMGTRVVVTGVQGTQLQVRREATPD